MTNTLQNRGLILSVIALGVIGALVGGATVAFYGDVERSTGNTFTAGGVELRVDSVAHYNNMICTDTDQDGVGDEWQPEDGFVPGADQFPETGTPCDGTWLETDLEDGVHTFFNFLDLKPGDEGEDTISLHVYDNPAWGQFEIDNVIDSDVSCTDPEQSAEEGACADDADGEIDDYLTFTGWVDHGATAGFQCGATGPDNAMCDEDPTEGDNIYQETEVIFWDEVLVSDLGPFDLAPLFASAYEAFDCQVEDGDTEYSRCHGFAEDGRMVPSVTYYFGLAWELPLATGNDAQTDTYQADMTFRVEQHRNNPNPFSSDEAEDEDDATMELSVEPLTLTATSGERVNFVASVAGDLGDFPDRTISVTATSGAFFLGTVGGDCNSDTIDADNEFDININRGICYQNTVEGVYLIDVTVLDEPAGIVVDGPEQVEITISDGLVPLIIGDVVPLN